MNPNEIARKLRASEVQLVRFLYCDFGGVIRGKAASPDRIVAHIGDGLGLANAMLSMTALDVIPPDASNTLVGEVRLVPDPDSFVILPYAPRSAQMNCDLVDLDHRPSPLCPRSFLKRMIGQLVERGFVMDAAFENEWYLARQNSDGSFSPFDRTPALSATGMESAEVIVQDVITALLAQGIQVEQYAPELGPGQQEISIRHAPALQAADHQITYRQTCRAIAPKHNVMALFAPKPFLNEAGSGAHIHFSLWNKARTRNLFADMKDPTGHGLTRMAYQFIGGVLKHLPALLAIAAPTVNSYRRLQPRAWSTAFNVWGIDNREAAIRVPSRYWSDEMDCCNLEFKPSDPSANPYLIMGALIAAGLDGLDQQIEPPLPLDEEPGQLSDEARAERGITRLPSSLGEALDALERDELVCAALGTAMTQEYLIVKRAEIKAFAEKDTSFELQQHSVKF